MELADVDLYDPDNFVEGVPHEMLAVLRREAPVYKHPHPTDGGFFWCVTKHADLIEINRDAKRFSSFQGGTNIDTPFDDDLEQARMMMLNQDPPAHDRLRHIVSRGFTPRRIREMHGRLEARARTIVDDIAERGECDFVQDVADGVPLQVIADLLGVPEADRRKLFEWSNTLIGFDDPEFQNAADDAMAAAGEIFVYAQGLADERRANPQDDIVDALLNAEIDGEHLTDMEFNMFFLLLSVAGNETTRNAMTHGMNALIDFPDQRQLLLDDPSLLDSRDRGDPALGDAGHVLPAHGDLRHDDSRTGDRRGRPCRHLAHVGQPRRGRLRRPVRVRHPTQPEPARAAHRLRRRRTALLPRRQPRPGRDEGHVPTSCWHASRTWSSPDRSTGSARTS